MLKHLRCIEPLNNHYKDYKIDINDNFVFCEWGRIGNNPQSKEFFFPNHIEALAFFDKKVREKINKGYEEI